LTAVMAKRFILREVPDGRPAADILAEIRQLYFKTTSATIDRDFDRAIDLLKTIATVEDRQRAHVYMEGLAEMRKEWGHKKKR
jgi:hypothetical protein